MKRIVLLALTVVLVALPLRAEAHHRPTSYCSSTGDICQSTTKVNGIRRLRIALFAKYFDRYRLCVRAPDGSRECHVFEDPGDRGRTSAHLSGGASTSRTRAPVHTRCRGGPAGRWWDGCLGSTSGPRPNAPGPMSERIRPSQKAVSFTESVIREMTRLAMEHDAINLAQGFPDFPAPERDQGGGARKAIADDINQYPITWGAEGFREAIARELPRALRDDVGRGRRDITRDVRLDRGDDRALLGVLDPGDEVVVFEPFYENYGPDSIISGAVPRIVTLHAPDWTFDEERARGRVQRAARGAIVINTPNNPTGKVFSREELDVIAGLCQTWGTVVFTDEIYEHIMYDGAVHVPPGAVPGLETERSRSARCRRPTR